MYIPNDVTILRTKHNSFVLLKFSGLTTTCNEFKQLTNSILIMEGLNSISITGVHFTNTESMTHVIYVATLINNNKIIS